MSDGVVARFEALLEVERRMILSGQFTELQDLLKDRDKSLGELNLVDLDHETLLRLQALVQRNRVLAEHAGEGVRKALKRLSDIKAASGPISSYSATGDRLEIGQMRHSLERKA